MTDPKILANEDRIAIAHRQRRRGKISAEHCAEIVRACNKRLRQLRTE